MIPLGGVLFAIKAMSHAQGVRGVVEAAVGMAGMAGVGGVGGVGGGSSPLLTVTIDRMETITLPVVDTTATAAATAAGGTAGAIYDAIGGDVRGGDGNNIIASHPFTHILTTLLKQWREFVALLFHHWTVLKQQIKTSTHSGGVYESVAQPLRQGRQMARNALECLTVEPVLTALLVVVRYIKHSEQQSRKLISLLNYSNL